VLPQCFANSLLNHADQPPPPPRGNPPPLEDGHQPVRGQWLIAHADINGEPHPYWFNPTLLDEEGRPVCTWTLPALASHTLLASSRCTLSSGSALHSRQESCVEAEVKACDGGGAVYLAHKVIIAVFGRVFPNIGAASSLPYFPCYCGVRSNCTISARIFYAFSTLFLRFFYALQGISSRPVQIMGYSLQSVKKA
jgi:hypothetical protein